MRTITTIKDLYWAFAEMHSANSIIIAGERNEYTLEDGRVVYVTDEEKRFLDAIKKFECADAPAAPATPVTATSMGIPKPDVTPEDILNASCSRIHGAVPANPTTPFQCLLLLKRRGLTGKARKHRTADAEKAVEIIDQCVTQEIYAAKKNCKDIIHELNKVQLEMTLERTKEYIWESLGERFDKALANAAKKLVCSTDREIYDKFLLNFMRGHARVGINKHGRAILYTTECTLGCEGETFEYPERTEILNSDFKYGAELGNPDSIALQLHMLNMHRIFPEYASKCYGTVNVTSTVKEICSGGRFGAAFDDEVDYMFRKYFGILNDAITRGVNRVKEFIYCSPFYDRIPNGEFRNSINSEIIEEVTGIVRCDLVKLPENDFIDIMKTMDAMTTHHGWNAFKRYPGAIVMKHIRLAFHEVIWRKYKIRVMC
ncbi:MAG: hypothetical protein IKA48_00685 [Fibrobacter sp.]|nr:hypothetical protein [Fibrobacter sp.]